MADDASGPPLMLRVNGLYQLHQRGARLLRLVSAPAQPGIALLKDVDAGWTNVPTKCERRLQSELRRLVQEERLLLVDYDIKPRVMLLSDEEIRATRDDGQKLLDQRDKGMALIGPMVGTEEALFEALDPETTNRVLNLRADELGWTGPERKVRLTNLRRLLHRYSFFGCVPNALLPLHDLKGSPERVIATATSPKRGAPNAATKLGMPYPGVNMTAQHERWFIAGLNEFYVGEDLDLRRTYEAAVAKYFVKKMKDLVYPIAARFIPTYEAFEKWAYKHIRRQELAAQKAGPKGSHGLTEQRGLDIDISPRAGQVYDVDASPGKVELVADFLVDGELVNIGTPQVVLVFDRRSKKCVGWNVYVGTENWKEGYRLAFFSAMTDKTADLERLEIPFDSKRQPWDVNLTPEYWYFDNGPASSKSAAAALDRMGINEFLAPPDSPYWKPTVEGGISWVHRALATLPGGYRRTGTARQKDVMRLAMKAGKVTVRDYEIALVLEIIKYNEKADKKNLLSHDMKRVGVEPSANAIFRFGVEGLGGAATRMLPTAVVYMALMERLEKPSQVTLQGVRCLTARFSLSPKLKAFFLRNPKERVQILHHPMRYDRVYWITPDGDLDTLFMDARSRLNSGTLTAYERELWELHNRGQSIKNANKPPRRSPKAITSRQQKTLRASFNQGKAVQRSSPTPNVSVNRGVAAKTSYSQKTQDDPSTYMPTPPGVPERTSVGVEAASANRAPATPHPGSPFADRTYVEPAADTSSLWDEGGDGS